MLRKVVEMLVPCPKCNGQGFFAMTAVDPTLKAPCHDCQGKGRVNPKKATELRRLGT